eukprot:Em0007g431a
MANFSGVSPSILNHAVLAVANGVSVLVCILAAILLCCLKLYKKLVYRLALYQVLSALAMASVSVMQVVFINYDKSPIIYGRICTALGFLSVYTEWTKLLFTMWVTFHLFCFAVLHKNLKKLELLYVVTSLLAPVVIATVPLTTNAYGLSPDGNACYIYANRSVAFIERLALRNAYADSRIHSHGCRGDKTDQSSISMKDLSKRNLGPCTSSLPMLRSPIPHGVHNRHMFSQCIQCKYIVIGNSISLDSSSETSAESAQSITSVLQVDQTFPRQDLSQTQPALAQKSELGRKR